MRRLNAGRAPKAGARRCGGELSLADFAREADGLRARFDSPTAPSVFAQCIGDEFYAMHPRLQSFHSERQRRPCSGRINAERPASFGARVLATWVSAPLENYQGDLLFTQEPSSFEETWTREIGHATFCSVLKVEPKSAGAILIESLGLAKVGLRILRHGQQIKYEITKFSLLEMPVPRLLWPILNAREWVEMDEKGSRVCIEVSVQVRGCGQVIKYSGHICTP